MTTVDQSQSPYYDSYDVDDKKGYIKLLFNPDRPLQARELNELQSILNTSIRQIADATSLKVGNIISGVRPVYSNKTDTKMDVTIQEGFIYMNGRAQFVSEQTVTIPTTGDAYIYATYNDRVVNSDQDDSLLDPTIGAPSVSSKGADRLQSYVSLSTTKQLTSVMIFHFVDGSLFIQNNNDLTGPIIDILARQTFETNGSYRVSGLELSVDNTQSSEGNVSILVSDGIGYVKGYRVDKPSQTRVQLPISKDVRLMNNEVHAYDSNQQYFALYNKPVSDVKTVSAPVLVTETVARKSSGDDGLVDMLQHDNVVAIKNVTSTKGTVNGTLDNPAGDNNTAPLADVTILNGNSIKWRQGSSVIPTSGASYQIQYYYNKTMVKSIDYKVQEQTTNPDKNGLYATIIDFRGMDGDKPSTLAILGGVYVSYEYYLARRDLLTLDSLGNITAIPGIPNTLDKVDISSKYDDTVLPLGWVTAFPNSQNALTNSYTTTNLTFTELQKMSARVATLEYNLGALAQDVSAATGHDPVTLRGIFSDGFNNLFKYDSEIFGNVKTDSDGNVISDNRWKENGEVINEVSFGFDDAMITLPYKSAKSQYLLINSVTKDSEYNNPMNWKGKVVSAPYKLIKEISQTIATGVTNINPYMVYATQTGSLKLSPSVDVWNDVNNITVNNVIKKELTVFRYWRHNGANYSRDSQFIYDNMNNIQWSDATQAWINDGSVGNRGTTGVANGTVVSNGGTQTITESIPHMRSIKVTFEASGLRPFDDNLYIDFNHIQLETTPIAPATQGASKGTIKADAKGQVAGSFIIPSGQPTGTVDVFIKNDAIVGSSANASFTSKGTKTTVKQIINTTFYQVKFVDPLAQSFQFSGDRIVAGVGIYFNQKDTTDKAAPVILQIRPITDGGLPSSEVLGEVIKESDDITTSTDATKATNFMFDDPVMLEDGKTYAFVLMTNSQNYLVYSAKMGQKRVDGNNTYQLTVNPYEGVMFSSANGQSWTVHQDEDLTFDIYTVEFMEGKESVVLFDPVTFKPDEDGQLPDITIANVDAYTPDNSGVDWYYRVVLANEPAGADITDGTHPWLPVGQFGEYDPGAQVRTLQFQAKFTPSKYTSPMLSTEVLSLGSVTTELKGTYVGKTVSGGGRAFFNTITYQYRSYEPAGTTVTPKFLFWRDGAAQPQKWETLDSLEKDHKVAHIVPDVYSEDADGLKIHTATFTMPADYAGPLGFSNFKVRLDLESKTAFVRPRAKALQVVATDQ